MISNTNIRSTAWNNLKQDIGVAVGAIILFFIVSIAISSLPFIGFILQILFTSELFFVSIDTYNDKENHHGFGITSAGAIVDGLWSGDWNSGGRDYDTVFEGEVQITKDGGNTWIKIDNIPGAPNQSYVNSVFTSQLDKDRIYVAFNHHKYGDFKPYIFMTEDMGNTWIPISSNLPNRGRVYAIEEDHEDP